MVVNQNIMKNMQKNRFFRKPKKPFNVFGDYGMACKNEGRLELLQISILRRRVKAFLLKKRNDSDVIREKIWYFGRPNFLIQKKSKNSRMGKGKGLIERKVIRVRRNFIILEFKGILPLKIKKLIKYINKIFSVKMYLVSNYEKSYSSLSKSSKYFIYYHKYLHQ